MGIEDIKEIKELINDVDGISLPNPDVIQVEFYNKKNNKSEVLINNSDKNISIKGKNIFYNFSYTERVWISHVIIDTENYHSWQKIEFQWFDKGRSFSEIVTNTNNSFVIEINDFVDVFSFKPPKTFESEAKLINIESNGFLVDDFNETISLISKIEMFKERIIDKSQSLITKADEAVVSLGESITLIEEKNKELDTLSNKYEMDKKEENGLIKSITSLKSEESDINIRINSLDDSIDTKKNEQKSLNSDIEIKRNELDKLNADINMFPSEIAGFVNEGERALKKYYALTFIPLIILASVVLVLFFGAVDLTTILATDKKTEIITIMLTRLPYVTVSAMLITACYQLVKYFVGQMVLINKQRIDLNKISIIANDTSIASFVGLGLSKSERYHARIQLKMELLKEHLKEDISQDYQYKKDFNVVEDEERISEGKH